LARTNLRPTAIFPLGDCAAYIEFSDKLDLEVNAVILRLAAAVHAKALPWVRDVVPALGGLALHFDPDHAAVHGDSLQASANLVQECLKEDLAEDKVKPRTVEVPVCYDPEFAPDIEEVAKKLHLSLKELAERHAASEHRVLMIGFAPGHAYMGGLDPKLAVPRRATPRANVPEGSVAIANDQTVVYPYTIPGGWSIIGRTPLTVFDAGRAEPSLFAPGDRVRFRVMTREEFLGMPR